MSGHDYLNREELIEGLVADGAALLESALAGETGWMEGARQFLNGPIVKQVRQDVFRRELGSILQIDEWQLHAADALGRNVALRERTLARRVIALIDELKDCKLVTGKTWAEENALRREAKLKEPF